MSNDLSATLLRPHLGAGAHSVGMIAASSFRAVTLTRHITPTATWEWGAQTALSPTHHAFLIAVDGEGIPCQGTSSAAVFLTPGARATISWPRHADVIIGWMPPVALGEFGDIARADVTPIADSVLARGLASFADALVPMPGDVSSVARYTIERLLVEMAFAAFLDQNSAHLPDRAPASLVDRGRALLLAHRSDRDYTTARLARELHVSVRHVQRAFSEVGTTPGAALRRNRLDLAVELLRHPDYSPLAIDEIAVHAGFTNALQLRRALRAEGMPTPSQLRNTQTRKLEG